MAKRGEHSKIASNTGPSREGPTNWGKVRRAYVTGAESYRGLAARFGVSLSSLSKVATKEGWAQKRQQYRNKLDAETEEALRARACAREVDRLERLEKAADRMAERLEALLEDEQQFYRYVTMTGQEGVGRKADMKAVRNFTASLAEMVKISKDLKGGQDEKEETGVVEIAPRMEGVGDGSEGDLDAAGDAEAVHGAAGV